MRYGVYIYLVCYREMCNLNGQLMLNLNTSLMGVYHNGDCECIALCHLARLHADQVIITWKIQY